LGPLALTALAATATPSVAVWPWLAGWCLSAALTYRHAAFEDGELLAILAPLSLGSALGVVTLLRVPAS
ncbi:MAG: hypothetical protein GWN82_08195, partial [Gemmatimonadetes bacterium]|nr:hypothetical protein [Gemmatimonadota bacterium]NIU30691.1 hypothetical protein [Gemmatimonadota bacterium]NIV61049.1 hypothetical protein [Gemmatimonadota bacterium]NIX39079.1 hypothetical protein [Gemmatimonadota bacterium]